MYENKREYTLEDNVRSMGFNLKKIADLLEKLVGILSEGK
jgi:hypothetical protein